MVTGLHFMMQEQQKNNHITQNFKELSIQINLSGLSFCIFNPALNCIESIYSYAIDFKHISKYETERQIREILQNEGDLRQDFERIQVLHNNEKFAFIPRALFKNIDDAYEYLKYSLKTDKDDFFEADIVEPLDGVTVYVPDFLVNNILLDFYGAFDYQHFATILLRMALKHYATHSQDIIYVHLERNAFHLIVFLQKKLLFFNRFAYESTEDVLYYLLYSLEQLNINTESTPLYFMGNIAQTDEIFEKTRVYIKNVFVMEVGDKPFCGNMDFSLAKENMILTQVF